MEKLKLRAHAKETKDDAPYKEPSLQDFLQTHGLEMDRLLLWRPEDDEILVKWLAEMVDEGLIHGHLTFGLRPFDLQSDQMFNILIPQQEVVYRVMTKMTLTSLPFYRLKRDSEEMIHSAEASLSSAALSPEKILQKVLQY